MAETSRSQVTITLGRTGQVVKRPGPVLDSAFYHSQEGLGSKRSVRDRLGGSNGDSSQLSNKRLRVDNTRLSTSAANSVDDTRLGRDDLRFKIMQKIKQTQSNGQQNGVDLREMLSRPARPSTKSLAMQQHLLDPRSGRHQMPELKDVRHRLPETKDVRLRVPEPDGVRQRMPEATSASILGRAPHMRTADALPQLVDLRSSYSTWTLEHLRQRSPDGVLGTSRGISPPRNGKEMQRRPLMRSYDDVRTVPYMGKDVLKVSRPMGTASFMAKPTLSAAPTKAVAPLLTPPPLSGVIQKSSYAVDEQHTVEGFLNSLGLEKYYISFRAEEVDMTALRQMGDNDLKELGIPMGPRKKILLALMPRSRCQV